jgi:HEAT repeat protein
MSAGCQTAATGTDGAQNAVALDVAAATFQSQQPDLSQEPPDDLPPLTERQQRQLQIFGPVLLNPSSDIASETRRSAAEELIAMNAPQAVALLAEGLRGPNPGVREAVVKATIAAPQPPDGLLQPLVQTLRSADVADRQDLGTAVARYRDGLEAVSAVAVNRELDVAERLGPIEALAAFRSREAAARLMVLLETGRGEPEDVIVSTCQALSRLTGLPNGENPAGWRRWWADAKDQSQEQWLARRVEQLTEQVSGLEQRLEQERQKAQRIEARLSTVYRDLFPALEYDDQLRALPSLLEDDLAAVRRFAMGRIERLLRDTVSMPQPLQEQLADRLDDEVPALRLQAAMLLHDLGYDGAAEKIAARLAVEEDPQVREGLLGLLAKRPTSLALQDICQALSEPALTITASEALWSVVRQDGVPQAELAATRAAVRGAWERAPREPAVARVMAAVGDDDDTTHLVSLLDDEEQGLRVAVAEGLLARGVHQALLDRSADELLYPFAVRALVAERRDRAGVEALIRMTPPAAHVQVWADGIREATSAMEPRDLVAIVDLLQTVPAADATLRRDLLQRVADAGVDALPPEVWASAIIRLADLLSETGDAPRGQTLVQSLDPTALTPEVRRRLFETALHVAAFELAAGIDNEATSWIDVLETLATRQKPHAAALRDEIARRFATELVDDVRDRFEAISAALPAGPRAADTPVSGTAAVEPDS